MKKYSQYMPNSIRGRQPRQPPTNGTSGAFDTSNDTSVPQTDDTSVLNAFWRMIGAPIAGSIHGLINSGVTRLEDHKWSELFKIIIRKIMNNTGIKDPNAIVNILKQHGIPIPANTYYGGNWFRNLSRRKPLQ